MDYKLEDLKIWDDKIVSQLLRLISLAPKNPKDIPLK